jgi:hypothetical protein
MAKNVRGKGIDFPVDPLAPRPVLRRTGRGVAESLDENGWLIAGIVRGLKLHQDPLKTGYRLASAFEHVFEFRLQAQFRDMGGGFGSDGRLRVHSELLEINAKIKVPDFSYRIE